MRDFPTQFADKTEPLTAEMFEAPDAELVRQLAEKGFAVHSGLTEIYAQAIINMCLQPSIKEYCPNDYGRRFSDLEAAHQWLTKGRAVFLLLKREGEGLDLYGYGWVGNEASPHVPGGETTFALRVGEQGQGQGLATPFSRLMVVGAAKLYEAKNIWLETWQSNGAAVHIYHKIGFEDVDQEFSSRPTANGETIEDTRLFMRLPNELLPA